MDVKKIIMGGVALSIGAIAFKMFEGRLAPAEESASEDEGCGCTGNTEAYESEYSLEYINPEPVSGSSDVHGAEGFLSNRGSFSHGRGFATEGIATAQMASVMEGGSPALAPGQRFVPNAGPNTRCAIGHSYNDLCPQCSTPHGKTTAVPVRIPPPYNPTDYQTLDGVMTERPISASAGGSGNGGSATTYDIYGQVWDNANDYMPEYRYPFPWSPAYLPTDPSRSTDYRMQRTY